MCVFCNSSSSDKRSQKPKTSYADRTQRQEVVKFTVEYDGGRRQLQFGFSTVEPRRIEPRREPWLNHGSLREKTMVFGYGKPRGSTMVEPCGSTMVEPRGSTMVEPHGLPYPKKHGFPTMVQPWFFLGRVVPPCQISW